MNPILKALKALRQLGLRQTFWYGVYQAGLRSGLWKRLTPAGRVTDTADLRGLFHAPTRDELAQLLDQQARQDLLEEANEIIQGSVRLFGGPAVTLRLAPLAAAPLQHWTAYELGWAPWGSEDVKDIWEPARFGWAFPLMRAFALSGDERCAAAFWSSFETFDAVNPWNMGPNWTSAQEVALRLLALVFAAQVFSGCATSTPERLQRLARAVVEHARRIVPTLSYARAQHNNHLISEALGLYAAGNALPGHAEAAKWRELGWAELNRALSEQIDAEGNYSQHSANYHRVMLQAALMADALRRREGRSWAVDTQKALASATRWLAAQLDETSGRVPNLGSNDGAQILPLAPGGFLDFRATVQAASRAFLGQACLPAGGWDEVSIWLNMSRNDVWAPKPAISPAVLRLGTRDDWATLRAVRFTSRPSHADQLHVEIWHAGENLALDAGTYRYSAPAPWNNALVSASVHNTVCVDGLEPMTRGGKFLWLDWDQARVLVRSADEVCAERDGYERLGVTHQRCLKRETDLSPNPSPEERGAKKANWVIDDVLTGKGAQHSFRLHWLLPDWPFVVDGQRITFSGPAFGFTLTVEADAEMDVELVRAGEVIYPGSGASETAVYGWQSPTYALRVPAISALFSVRGAKSVHFSSVFEVG